MLEKELERAGIPTVQICTILPIAQTVGANRIVRAVAIPHPVGVPDASAEQERIIRETIMENALTALQTEVQHQLVLE